MAKKFELKEKKAAIEIGSRRLAILERLAQGDITVRESWKLLDEIETSRAHDTDFKGNSTSSIPQHKIKQLVMDKIAICNDRKEYELKDYFTEA